MNFISYFFPVELKSIIAKFSSPNVLRNWMESLPEDKGLAAVCLPEIYREVLVATVADSQDLTQEFMKSKRNLQGYVKVLEIGSEAAQCSSISTLLSYLERATTLRLSFTPFKRGFLFPGAPLLEQNFFAQLTSLALYNVGDFPFASVVMPKLQVLKLQNSKFKPCDLDRLLTLSVVKIKALKPQHLIGKSKGRCLLGEKEAILKKLMVMACLLKCRKSSPFFSLGT
jgi:hypothetical protein